MRVKFPNVLEKGYDEDGALEGMMSCGGSALVGESCGCGPGVNAHESYKGSSGPKAMTYSVSARYQGNESPLPKTALTRSYALERIYVGNGGSKEPERVYRTELSSLSVPGSFESSSLQNPLTHERQTSQPTNDARAMTRYDTHCELSELMSMEDTYNKQRFLSHKIAEALQSKSIDVLVNTHG
ncbi:MAG TPA: hypothetical protein VLJ21_04760 [Candidatus Binatia bacterium]|nr:hypothetical protein [Candidatus Binatia bacterium]